MAWNQLVIGNTVYVAGQFAKARPAGSAPGVNTVTRSNLLAYDITTGVLKASFVANLNAQAFVLAKSPDNSRLYVGGDFTTVNGIARNRVAALDPVTGTPLNGFNVSPNSSVRAIAVSGTKVYLGGYFTTVNNTTRNQLAAVSTAGVLDPTWRPIAGTGHVNAMVISPDLNKIMAGGSFISMNGSTNPGYGLAMLNTTTGANLPLPTNSSVRNAGTQSAILSLASDSTNVYGTGYVFGAGGVLEGSFSTNWSDGSLKWLEDCHGDSYGVFPGPLAIYVASHSHSCANTPGEGANGFGFPNMPSGAAQRAIAFSRAQTGTLKANTEGTYQNFAGLPAPSLQNWFPQLTQGSVTGQSQAAWSVAGSTDGRYVVYGGEFPRVQSSAQQGLVRFAVKSIAPNLQGPKATASSTTKPFTLTLTQPIAGQYKISWTANYDWDNSNLTYRVFRDGSTAPLSTVNRLSTWWNRPEMNYTDTSAPVGNHTYRVSVRDPFGATVSASTVNSRFTVVGTTTDRRKPK